MLKKFKILASQTELQSIVNVLPCEGIILLNGTLASGKTTLCKAIVARFGVDESVNSPTFSIMQNYGEIYHYDLYNGGSDAIIKNGLIENLFADGLHIIEWPDMGLLNFISKYELEFCEVNIKICGDKREYEVIYA